MDVPAIADESKWQYGHGRGALEYVYDVKVSIGENAEVLYEGTLYYRLTSTADPIVKLTVSGTMAKKSGDLPAIFQKQHWIGSRAGSRGYRSEASTISLSRSGKVVHAERGFYLPYLLGNAYEIPFETLPELVEGAEPIAPKHTWSIATPVPIVNTDVNSSTSFSRLLGNSVKRIQPADCLTDYELVAIAGTVGKIKKTMRMARPVELDLDRFDMTGEGTWQFNLADGMPQSGKSSLNLKLSTQGSQVAIPVVAEFKRKSAKEVEELHAAQAKSVAEGMQRIEEMREQRRQEAAPLSSDELEETVNVLKSGSKDAVIRVLTRLGKAGVSAEPDPRLLEGIKSKLSTSNERHSHRDVPGLADAAARRWLAGYAEWADARDASQGGHSRVSSDGGLVTPETPLIEGQIVLFEDPQWKSWFYPSEIVTLNPDGTLMIRRLDPWRKKNDHPFLVGRNYIKLAPPEFDQPGKPGVGSPFAESLVKSPTKIQPEATTSVAETSSAKKAVPPVPVTESQRIWTDSTGLHRIEATLIGIADGKVQLRKADGKEVTVPLEKLSEQDRAYAKKKDAENPFE